jgi:putative modified peptide
MSSGIPTSAQLDQILSRLGSDDAYREKFLGDPAGAFGEYGIAVDPSEVPAVRKLPSKDALKSQAAAIRAKADGKSCLAFFALGA